MSLHALLARAEEHQRAAEHDAAECDQALAMLKASADSRKSDARYHKRVHVRLRGLIDALNEGTAEQRAAYDLSGVPALPVRAEEDDRAAPEGEEEIATPPPAPEPPAEAPKIEPEARTIAPEAPKPAPAAPRSPAGSTLQERVMAALNSARGASAYASVDLMELRTSLGVSPSKLTGALTALADAKRIVRLKSRGASEPGQATYQVLEAVEQAA